MTNQEAQEIINMVTEELIDFNKRYIDYQLSKRDKPIGMRNDQFLCLLAVLFLIIASNYYGKNEFNFMTSGINAGILFILGIIETIRNIRKLK